MSSNTDTQDASTPAASDGQRQNEASDGATGLAAVSVVAFDVQPGDAVAAECPYCGRPFAEEAAHDLHVGENHADQCTDAERAAYEDANDAERDDLFYFHIRIVAALGVLYGAVVLVYMLALGSGII